MRISSLDSALAFERTTQCVRLNAARSIMASSARYFADLSRCGGYALDAAEGLVEFPPQRIFFQPAPRFAVRVRGFGGPATPAAV